MNSNKKSCKIFNCASYCIKRFYRPFNSFFTKGRCQRFRIKFLKFICTPNWTCNYNCKPFETVKKQAVTDPLTELFNRRFYEDALSREAVRALRLNQPFSLISLDLDKLKHINDTLGHAAGDAAIKAVARVINKNSRSVDVPSRVGGEEFTIILPGLILKALWLQLRE